VVIELMIPLLALLELIFLEIVV